MDDEKLVNAISRVLKRLAEKGWLESTVITEGHLQVNYTELGSARMRVLKNILIGELSVALTAEEFQALMALLLMIDKKPSIDNSAGK